MYNAYLLSEGRWIIEAGGSHRITVNTLGLTEEIHRADVRGAILQAIGLIDGGDHA